MADARTFEELAGSYGPALDELALAMAAEFRPVDAPAARARLDALGEELAAALAGAGDAARRGAGGLRAVLGPPTASPVARGSDHPDARRCSTSCSSGAPGCRSCSPSSTSRSAAARALPLHGVGMPGHFVVGALRRRPADRSSTRTPAGGRAAALEPVAVRPWSAHEIAMRMLNNLVARLHARARPVGAAIHAARLRRSCRAPATRAHRHDAHQELRALEARLNLPRTLRPWPPRCRRAPRRPRSRRPPSGSLRPTALLRRCHARHGEPFTLRLAWMDGPLVLVSDPADVKRLFGGDPGVLRGGASSAVLEAARSAATGRRSSTGTRT